MNVDDRGHLNERQESSQVNLYSMPLCGVNDCYNAPALISEAGVRVHTLILRQSHTSRSVESEYGIRRVGLDQRDDVGAAMIWQQASSDGSLCQENKRLPLACLNPLRH